MKERNSVFERLVRTGFHMERGTGYLEKCMSLEPHLNRIVPLRFRLIALGFIQHCTLEELNAKLQANGCEKLYTRNIWEAGLTYAFLKGMSFEEWKRIEGETEQILGQQPLLSPYFNDRVITVDEIRKYVEDNSDETEQILHTKHRTQILSEKLKSTANGEGGFAEFLVQNLSEFSTCREKARYYFCKYLLYFLDTKIAGFIMDMRNGTAETTIGSGDGMNVFKGMATQRRKKQTPEEMEKFLGNAGISCGEIFDGFNRFYYEYVTADWMEVLLEHYDADILHLPKEERRHLAEALRHYRKDFAGLTDDEVLTRETKFLRERERELDQMYSTDVSVSKKATHGYQSGRQGENTIRKYIRGELDIDRISLIFYILYFGYNAEIPAEYQVTAERLSDILQECGYSRLRPQDEFDSFVLEYLEADDPVDFLMDTVTGFALEERNFYLYRHYQFSESEDAALKRLL